MTYPPQYPQQYQPQYQGPAPTQYQQAAAAPTQQAPAQQTAPAFQSGPGFIAASGASDFPRMADLRGRLLLITPRKVEIVPSQTNPGSTFESVGSDVVVLDGGPVVSTDPAANGKVFDGHAFTNIGLSGVRVARQLKELAGTGQVVLGRINTQQGTGPAAKGNAWGVETQFTPQDAELATRYLNGDRSFVVMPGQAQGPVQQAAQQFQQGVQQYSAQTHNAAPGYGQPAAPGPYGPPAPQAPQQYQAPAQQGPPPADPWAQQGPPLGSGPNPFARQG